ncbi:beta-lactamase [Paracidovorax avenae ATCC 19860]|uniref:beta-lactamase n=1 Tax=Paracidovorax avenae (strain ATCC 19860 / DSM 7227 / CCUG 15838 / JCM 20985 / LMG 2117 / NCPPB 1011) TaxID=643561 RepID=F0Q210_PARA1|nr:serine hydrolase [Paracidovorax avenae]ADX44141.1 beta-lactamase [Paracidovorax avenae ATCC 19860]
MPQTPASTLHRFRPAGPLRQLRLLACATSALWHIATGTAHAQAADAPSATLAAPSSAPAWVQPLERALARVEADSGVRIGVYVRDLDTGASASLHGTEPWYLASSVKVPVAIAVLRGVERGDFTLETPLTLRAADYVDGAGPTNSRPVGTPLTVRYLLEQMIIYSDNTATDMLIGLVGIGTVNAVVQSLVPRGFGRITSLADVRRHVYGVLTPAASHLSGTDFLALRQQQRLHGDAAARSALATLLRVPERSLAPTDLASAYETYYATGLNSGHLDAYADLLQALVEGRALDARHTAYLLSVMERVKTGTQRIKAGLPPGARFAHKTGTQRARTCDSGLVTVPRSHPGPRLLVVACTRGEPSTARSDRALRQVGIALCQSGLLSDGRSHEPRCPTLPSRSTGATTPGDAPAARPPGAGGGAAPADGAVDDDA